MEDAGVLRFILQVLAVLLGGGTVQLILQLVRRRSELRKVNSESDSVVVAAANNQVIRLEEELKRVSRELETVRRGIVSERTARDSQIAELQRIHTEALAAAQTRSNLMVEEFRQENERLNKLVVRLQSDLSKARAEIATLRRSE